MGIRVLLCSSSCLTISSPQMQVSIQTRAALIFLRISRNSSRHATPCFNHASYTHTQRYTKARENGKAFLQQLNRILGMKNALQLTEFVMLELHTIQQSMFISKLYILDPLGCSDRSYFDSTSSLELSEYSPSKSSDFESSDSASQPRS